MPSRGPLRRFSTAIQQKYRKKGWQQHWESEKDIILELAEEIFIKSRDGHFRYKEALGVGSTGVVLWVWDDNMLANRAMKLPRPRRDLGSEIRETFEGEIQRLLALNHQNIVRIYHRGSCRCTPNMETVPLSHEAYETPPNDNACMLGRLSG